MEVDGALKLKLASGNEAEVVPVFMLAGWPNSHEPGLTTDVATVVAANRETATSENDRTAVDVVHGAPNILSDCSIFKIYQHIKTQKTNTKQVIYSTFCRIVNSLFQICLNSEVA